ncbi:putative adenylate/guanylate cyclase [Magnetofaba australis IT-1]|uniref:Putative adenylate/guanylate cyclase n=2 Tax=Magnetofaba TaxID=1472292 RepID=A0A1Y2KB55_9PROT|nr:putative adenylate/guanylate cyclase [Magnetofaba australis IT-1]
MFADIAGSTRLYEELGDAKAREVTSRCIEMLTRLTELHEGKVVKTIGDEVMCIFPSADLAAEAAIRMQEDVEEGEDELGHQLHVRIGFHFGEVIREMERKRLDVFGDAVNLAARMVAQAKAEQIITTGETLQEVSPDIAENSRMLITTTVKGKTKPVEIFELTWGEEDDLTVMGGMPSPGMAQQQTHKLTLRYSTEQVELGPSRDSITLGRGKQSEFRVPDNMSSRVHCKIEFRRDRFVIVDQSTNGTYVSTSAGENFFVHRDERRLTGQGVIGLGQKLGPSDDLAVHFDAGDDED